MYDAVRVHGNILCGLEAVLRIALSLSVRLSTLSICDILACNSE